MFIFIWLLHTILNDSFLNLLHSVFNAQFNKSYGSKSLTWLFDTMRYVISPMQFLIKNYTQNIYIFAWNDQNPIELNNNWSSISAMEQT